MTSRASLAPASVFVLSLVGFGCDASRPSSQAESSDAGDRDASAPDVGALTSLHVLPDRVTLLGPGHGRQLDVLGRGAGNGLFSIPEAAVAYASSDETVVAVISSRARALRTGAARIVARAGGAEAVVEVEVLSEPAPFASLVLDRTRGAGAGFGESRFPEIVLGPPRGGGLWQGSLDVLSLGIAGSITLSIAPFALYDGPGADLLVFENPFVLVGVGEAFVEPGRVSVGDVSSGVLSSVPCDVSTYRGCAGLSPVLAGTDDAIDPTDPRRAGGDAFDLSMLGSRRATFVRIEDLRFGVAAADSAGFDLDAIAAISVMPADAAALEPGDASPLVLRAGEEAPVPRFDLVRASGSRVRAQPVLLSVSPNGAVELGANGVIFGRARGHAVLTASAADFSARREVQVLP